MTWSAPAAAASCALSGLLTVAMTVASAQRASWIAALPTAPAPPCTSTVRPFSVPGPIRSGSDSATVRQRCAVRNGMRERRAELEGRLGAEQHGLPGRDDGVLGRRPEGALVGGLPDPHPLTDEDRVDALADGVDRAGAVLVRGLPARARVGVGAGLPVGRVHAGERDADAHLAGAGLRDRPVDQLQDVGAAGAVVGDGSHAVTQPGGPRVRQGARRRPWASRVRAGRPAPPGAGPCPPRRRPPAEPPRARPSAAAPRRGRRPSPRPRGPSG